MQEEKKDSIVTREKEGLRIDKFLAEQYKEFTRTYIQKLIKEQRCFVNGSIVKANYKVMLHDKVVMIIPKLMELDIKAEKIPLDILYEDQDIILINKSKGMVVHPAAGHPCGTIVNALLYHCKGELSGINGVMRPGIVHRIDKDTTGVIVVCKNDKSHLSIAQQLKEHSITRKYEAIVYEPFSQLEGTIEGAIGRHPIDRKKMSINMKNGKCAVTHYKVLENLSDRYAYLACCLETGRTHQIRVHMASIKHPLIGDLVYGYHKDPFHLQGQVLHAKTLGFYHPITNKYMEFEAPLPEYFQTLLKKLR